MEHQWVAAVEIFIRGMPVCPFLLNKSVQYTYFYNEQNGNGYHLANTQENTVNGYFQQKSFTTGPSNFHASYFQYFFRSIEIQLP